MTQLFISYSRENRDTAERVAHALADAGVAVWWDRDLPGGSAFAEVIEQRLNEARVAIVLWSEASVRSGFVRDESMRALEAGKLLPVRIEEVVPPLGFGQIHALDLLDWDGAADDPAFVAVTNEVRRRLGQSPTPLPRRGALRARGPRKALVAGIAALVLALAGVGTWQWWLSSESSRNLRLGLEEQFGREPNLQAARNYYLDALERRPANARARYYLGHVYAQLGELQLARSSFERAARDREGLDEAQLSDANARVAALAPAAEPVALARATTSSTPVAAGTTSAAQPAAQSAAQSAGKAVDAGKGPKTAAIGGATGHLGTGTFPAAVATRPAGPPHLPPAEAVRHRVAQLVEQMFSSDSQTRITSTTTLVTDPDLLSDAVPVAVQSALDQLAAARGEPGAALQSGVVNTLVLLQSAMPGTLAVNRGSIESLLKQAPAIGKYTASQAQKVQALLDAAATRRPVAFIQIANEAQRPIAEALAVRLRAAGYDAPGIELVGDRAPPTGQIRVQGRSERGFARWLAKVAGEAGGEAVALQTLRNVSPKTDTFEVWFDKDLCTAAHADARCGATAGR